VLCLFIDREFHLLTSKSSYENQVTAMQSDALCHWISENCHKEITKFVIKGLFEYCKANIVGGC